MACHGQTITITCYTLHGRHPDDVGEHRARAPWYLTKTNPSFADMLAKLRRTISPTRFTRSAAQPTPTENHDAPANMAPTPLKPPKAAKVV